MTAPRSSSQDTPAGPSYRGRLFAVVLVAAWVGAFAVTSAPGADVSNGAPPASSGQHLTAS
jgi:hypothetical protein